MDAVLDGSVEDIFGLFSRQVYPWFKSRSSKYLICILCRRVCFSVQLSSVGDQTEQIV